MTALLERVDEATKVLVNGFVRDIQKLMTYWTIPSEIIDQCIIFYHLQLLWDLSGINRDDSTIICNTAPTWRTAPLNQSITSKLCNIFEIEMTLKEGKYSCIFCIGFFKDDLRDLNRGDCLTLKSKTDYLFLGGARVSRNNEKVNQLSRAFGIGDSIKMIFNFKKNECKWFVDFEDEAILIKPIDADAVIPAFSFFWTFQTFEMTRYSLQ